MSTKKKQQALSEDSVSVSTLSAVNGDIGILTLNNEKALNSLTLGMVRTLNEVLIKWQGDDSIKAIILKGAGKKAFCAGGDVQALYHSAINKVDGVAVDAEQFFLEEYQLDYLIHCYDKPIICIGSGIVMGGGLGLLSGASHRVVTESTRMAMPEITIGLFPDVGGTHFLNQVPFNLGYFLALTGAPLNAEDTIVCNLADHVVSTKRLSEIEDRLASLNFSDDPESHYDQINEILNELKAQKGELAASEIKQNLTRLETACAHNSLCLIVEEIEKFDDDNPFLAKAKKTMTAGSPLSLLLIYEQLKRHRYHDLQRIFESELILATNMVRHPEFAEGVRALLIDKDRSPNWTYKHFSDIPCSLVESFFSAPWGNHPLDGKLL